MENEVPRLPGDSDDMEISSGPGGPIRSSRGTDAVRVVKFVGFALLFNLLLWLFALFAQIRGWVDVTASYFILLAMWVVGTLICLALGAQLRLQRKRVAIGLGSVAWAGALMGLNAIAPKPGAPHQHSQIQIVPDLTIRDAVTAVVQPAPLPAKPAQRKPSLAPTRVILERPYDLTGRRREIFLALLKAHAGPRDTLRIGCLAWSDPACVAAGRFLILLSEAGWSIDSNKVFRLDAPIPTDGTTIAAHVDNAEAEALKALPPHLGRWHAMDQCEITIWTAFRWMQIPVQGSSDPNMPQGTIGIYFGPVPPEVSRTVMQVQRELGDLLGVLAIESKVVEQQCKTSADVCANFRAQFYSMISAYLQNCDCDLNPSLARRWKTLDNPNGDMATEIGREKQMLNTFASELKASRAATDEQ
jgi:hypothetical protein